MIDGTIYDINTSNNTVYSVAKINPIISQSSGLGGVSKTIFTVSPTFQAVGSNRDINTDLKMLNVTPTFISQRNISALTGFFYSPTFTTIAGTISIHGTMV